MVDLHDAPGTRPEPGRLRIGVFYDGGWFAHVSDFFAHEHPWRSRIALAGLHDGLRWHLHNALSVPLAQCELAEVHYVRGRFETPSTAFESMLSKQGVHRHDLQLTQRGERGVDVYLALETYERTRIASLDVVALLTGDQDLVPLVDRLRDHLKVRVLVPRIDVTRSQGHLRVAPTLIDAATDTPTWDELLRPGLTSSLLAYPFVTPVSAASDTVRPDESRRTGTITRWNAGATSGFITEAGTGTSWFISQDNTPNRVGLVVGAKVTFTGRPNPRPGKRYPEAFAVEPTATPLPTQPTESQA